MGKNALFPNPRSQNYCHHCKNFLEKREVSGKPATKVVKEREELRFLFFYSVSFFLLSMTLYVLQYSE